MRAKTRIDGSNPSVSANYPGTRRKIETCPRDGPLLIQHPPAGSAFISLSVEADDEPMNWHRLCSAILCLSGGSCGGGEATPPPVWPTAVPPAAVRGLRLKIAGWQEGTCSGSVVSQPFAGGSGSGNGFGGVQWTGCIRKEQIGS